MTKIVCVLLIAGMTGSWSGRGQSRADYEARKHQTEYHGPGREEELSENPPEIKIGYFGPSDSSHPDGGDAWLAACLAIEEENADGGYEGKPFRLCQGWSDSPWGSGITAVTQMVYKEEVWAIIGSVDGASTHLAEQVVAKARVTLINPGSTDMTINLANVPWMFSCLPGEHLQIPALLRALPKYVGQGKLTILSSTDHDSRVFVARLLRGLSEAGVSPAFHFQFEDLQKEPLDFLDAAVLSSEVIFIAAGARASSVLFGALRKAGFTGAVFGTVAMGRRSFFESLPAAVGTVIFPVVADPPSPEFTARYIQYAGRTPDYVARQTYDSVRLLVEAIRQSGLNRALIRDEIRRMSPWEGEAGLIDWDPLGHNRRPVGLATIHIGRPTPLED